MIKVATWNVNSVNARLERLLAYLQRENPDVLCLQELKCESDKFPLSEIRKRGYEASIHGQKTYNGVAVLSKSPITAIANNFGDGADDPAARFLLVETYGIKIASAYIPNGQEVGSEKFNYKLQWLTRLRSYFERNYTPNDPILLGGDFNVAPEDRDVYDPKGWEGKLLFSEPERQHLSSLYSWGFQDTFRQFEKEGGHYSWWDYRMGAFHRNMGLRIDFLLVTPPLSQRCTGSHISRDERKGEKPSDHAPVWATFQ